jgi:hypothetical protein
VKYNLIDGKYGDYQYALKRMASRFPGSTHLSPMTAFVVYDDNTCDYVEWRKDGRDAVVFSEQEIIAAVAPELMKFTIRFEVAYQERDALLRDLLINLEDTNLHNPLVSALSALKFALENPED